MNKMLITTAGLAEIVNAEQSGTAPVVLSHVAFGTGQYTATADMTKLKSEFKRFDAVAGGAISDNMIHLTIHDNSTDAYTVNEVGVFTAGGTLFAVISQTTPIIEKSATSESMLAIDIALTDIDASSITFGDTNLVLNPATTDAAGIVELATDAEAKTGTDTTRAMTPAAAKAARDADANIVHRTGNETIAGSKTFTSNPAVKAVDPQFRFIQNDIVKGTKPETDQHSAVLFRDNADAAMGCIQNIYASDGSVHTRLGAYQPVAGSTSSVFLDMVYPASGDPYATAPTPAAGDNSTKIATTAFVNTKGKEFLPLAGGTMSGSITFKGTVAALKNADDSYLELRGATDYQKGAYLRLDGKDSSKGGSFTIATGNGTNNIEFSGKTSGELIWNGKNIVRSVNGTVADAAGNVAITSVESATKATQDGTGKVIADTYLPKSGGAMTVTKAMYRDVNNSHLGLHGGTGTDNDGAQLDLCGSEHSSMPGVFQLHARTPDKDVILRGMTDGKLTWGDKYVLTNSYVATVDNGAVMLTAGTQSVKGAYLRLYGADHSTGAGTFAIAASDGTTSKSLTGNADGSLTWGGENILTPAGMVSPFAGTTAPSGWLVCDGSEISRTKYAKLFEAIGTAYGEGDGSTTFNLPEQSVLPLGTAAKVKVFGNGYTLGWTISTAGNNYYPTVPPPVTGTEGLGIGASTTTKYAVGATTPAAIEATQKKAYGVSTNPDYSGLTGTVDLAAATGATAIVCIKY